MVIMKKLNDFSRTARIVTVVSAGWLIIITFFCVFSVSAGASFYMVLILFSLTGLLPVVVFGGGVMWIISAPKKNNRNSDD